MNITLKLQSSKSGSHALLHFLFDLAASEPEKFHIKRIDPQGSSPSSPEHMSFTFADRTGAGLPWTLIVQRFDHKNISISPEDSTTETDRSDIIKEIRTSFHHLYQKALLEKSEDVGSLTYVDD